MASTNKKAGDSLNHNAASKLNGFSKVTHNEQEEQMAYNDELNTLQEQMKAMVKRMTLLLEKRKSNPKPWNDELTEINKELEHLIEENAQLNQRCLQLEKQAKQH